MGRLKKGLALAQTDILPVHEAISIQALQLIDTYALSEGLRSADALIAATALIHNLALLTANRKHFAAIASLEIEVFTP